MSTSTFPSNSGITVRDIFDSDNNWNLYRYFNGNTIRDIEIIEVEKMLSCNDGSRGYFVYQCPHCDAIREVGYGCRSRLCSQCGKYYTDQWAKNLSRAMFDVPHRHIVLGCPPAIWSILLHRRDLWKVMMDSAITGLNAVLSHKHHKRMKIGAIIVLHPFSRDLSFKPHLHLLITEGGFYKNHWVSNYYFPHNAMRKTWQYHLLTNLKRSLPKSDANSRFIHSQFQKYPNGFYAYLPQKGRIVSKRDIAKYVGRYVRHPAIANSRIVEYDGFTVKYWYKDNEEKRHHCSLSVMKFIQSIIQHIPERQFKMIRYYGIYSRRLKKKYRIFLRQQSIRQLKLTKSSSERHVICPKCGHLMEFLRFLKPGPPIVHIFGRTIEDWRCIAQAKAQSISLTK